MRRVAHTTSVGILEVFLLVLAEGHLHEAPPRRQYHSGIASAIS